MRGKHLGEFEQLVLLAILRQSDKGAYAPGIRKELDHRAGREVSRGALYQTLDRLEEKSYLVSEYESADEIPERGGQPLRLFRLTPGGLTALRHSRGVLLDMWSGFEHLLNPS